MSIVDTTDPTAVQAAAIDMIRANYPDDQIMRTLGIDFGTLREYRTAYGHMQRAAIFGLLRDGKGREEIISAFPGIAPDRIDGYIAEHSEAQRHELMRLIAAGTADDDITRQTGYRPEEIAGLRSEYDEMQRENAFLLIRRNLPAETICAQLAITPEQLDELQADYPAWAEARKATEPPERVRR